MNAVAAAEKLWEMKILHNTLWQWGGLLAVLLASFLVGKFAAVLLGRQVRRMESQGGMDLLRVLVHAVAGPISMLFLAAGLYASQAFLTLDVNGAELAQPQGPVRTFWLQVSQTIAALGVSWFIYRLVEVVDHLLNRWADSSSRLFAMQLAPLIRKSLRVFVIIMAAMFVAQNIFQMNVGALLAGLGIGGLALALGAQEALSNFFGSIVIFADHPFALSDRIKVRDRDGFVQEIGFRSTKLALLTGEQVTIPNSIVAKEIVENISRRPHIRRVLNITVTYGTSPARLRRAVEIVKDVLARHGENFDPTQPAQVYFNEFNADSLNIVAYTWFVPPDWWQYLAVHEQINLELLERFNQEGIEFAFPTRTLHLRKEEWPPASSKTQPPSDIKPPMQG